MSSNKKGSLFSLLTGVIAGAAIGYFMSSEEGKKTRKRLQEDFDKLSKNVKEVVKEKASKASDAFSDVADKVKEQSEELKADAQKFYNEKKTEGDDVISKAKDELEDWRTAFKKGVDKTKSEL